MILHIIYNDSISYNSRYSKRQTWIFFGKHDKYYNVYNFEEEQTIELESRIEHLHQVTLNKSSTVLVPLNVSKTSILFLDIKLFLEGIWQHIEGLNDVFGLTKVYTDIILFL